MKWFYLAFIVANFLSAAVFLLAPRFRATLGRQRALWLAPLISLPFLTAWDYMGHHLGWWRFTETYLTGWRVGALPVEEVVFLYCVPFACLAIWAVMRSRAR